MISKYFLLGAIAAISLSACSTAYKAGQTPDDVYYSPGREGDAHVVMENRQNNQYNNYEDPDDRYLRMMVRNRNRWSTLDPYYYNSIYGINNPYFYGNNFGVGFNSGWNNYWYWNNFYNPYMPPVLVMPYYPVYPGKPGSGGTVTLPKTNVRAQPFNPYSYKNGYTNGNTSPTSPSNNNNYKVNNGFRNGNTNANRGYNNSNNTQYRQNNNNTYTPPANNNSYTPTRTYNPTNTGSSSSGSSRSSGGSTGGGGGVARPGRGGN